MITTDTRTRRHAPIHNFSHATWGLLFELDQFMFWSAIDHSVGPLPEGYDERRVAEIIDRKLEEWDMTREEWGAEAVRRGLSLKWIHTRLPELLDTVHSPR
jgi:hypothetical protein